MSPTQNMIGLFGGSFDPVHAGHLHLAEQVQDRLSLDQIQFMPCANPVHREQLLTEASDRLRMLELVLSDQPSWQVNTIELDRGGPSYTVDSLRLIHARQPLDCLCLLLGVDAFNTIEGWKSSEQILKLAHLVVCRRPGSELNRNIYSEYQINDPEILQSAVSGFILPLDIDENACSSTEVRRLLKNGESVAGCLPSVVSGYIEQHKLYENQRE